MSIKPHRLDRAALYEWRGPHVFYGGAFPANSRGVRFVDGVGTTGWPNVYSTIQAAIDDALAGDVIYIAPGQYDETVTVNVAKLTLIGVGGRGAVYIENDTSGGEGVNVTADDVTLINIGVAGHSVSDYSLQLFQTSRFRAYGCKIEGSETALLKLNACGDSILEDCEFAWGVNGVVNASGGGEDPSTQTVLKNCRFHNITTVHVTDGTNHVANLQLIDCVFDAAEDGTEPTDYLLIDTAASTGVVTGCRFAQATNASATLTIAAGIQWLANATEAGWSTARPS